jgi:excisionase family DNA binding protein
LSEEEFLTVEEAAARLKLHPETIRRWIRSGRMRGALLGSDRAGYRVPASEVELRLRGQHQLELPQAPQETPKKRLAA